MAIDFEQVRSRLARAEDALSKGQDEAALRALLQERARKVAARGRRAEARRAAGEVVAVRRQDACWGFPIDAVAEVRRVELCALPGLSGAVQGLFQIRGQAHALVDLQALVETATAPAHGETVLAVVISGTQGLLGVRIDELLGRRSVYADECEAGLQERRLDFVSAVTRDLLGVIDVERLMARPEVIVESAVRA